MSVRQKNRQLILSALFLAAALLLPFLTAQMQPFGKALCPMHIPVLLCGFFCGPLYAALVGFIAPLLRFSLFGMPPLMPTGLSMAAELATYGLLAGGLYRWLPKKKVCIYLSLLGAMLGGRLVWGAVQYALCGLTGTEFGISAFYAGAVLQAIPGILLQIILIPLLVMALQSYTRPRGTG